MRITDGTNYGVVRDSLTRSRGRMETLQMENATLKKVNRPSDDADFCLLYINTNFYNSIIGGLKYFYPRMVPGGFIIVHGYSSIVRAEIGNAVDLFFADKPESITPIPDIAGTAIIRRLRLSAEPKSQSPNTK